MKKFLSAILIASVLLGLTACSDWGQDEFLFVTPHAEQPVSSESTEEEVPLTVTNRSELRGAVLSFIRDWTERGTFLVSGYSGDITADLAETIRYATEEDPIGAYAVDYADAELSGNGESGVISLNIVFRRSAAEINSIVTVNGIDGACAKIQQALTEYNTALTLGRLGQAVHQPRLPDKGASMQYDFSLPPSAYLEDDLAQASRICPKEAHYEV